MSSNVPWLMVFDLDGTLIDSSLDLCLAVNAAMSHVDAPVLPPETIASFIGDGAETLVRRALGRIETPDSHVAGADEQQNRFDRAFPYFLDFYREHKLDNTRLYDGVLPALKAIRAADPALPMAVLTNKPVIPSREICEGLGVASFFFAIHGGNSFKTKKPDPGGLLALMEEARSLWRERGSLPDDLAPGGVVMVGDSEIDVLTAKRASAQSLGCRYGLSPDGLELAKPDQICDSPLEWPRLLNLQRQMV